MLPDGLVSDAENAGGMNILVAEDDVVSRTLLVRTLEKWGYRVLAAEDGTEAWDIRQSESVRLVVTDWMMPGMDGPDLCRRIRSLKDGRYDYIILLTSKSDKESLIEGLQAGADDFVAKPFNPQELKARLNAGRRILALQSELQTRIEELGDANTRINAANRRMKEDLEAAAEVQKTFLPRTEPEVARSRFAWLYRPCEDLGGDCLNIFALNDRYVGVVMIDVSGHGVQAALLSVTLSRILRPDGEDASILKHIERDSEEPLEPLQVARILNDRFPLNTKTGQYFTLFYGVLDSLTGEFRYTTAGHPGPFLVTAEREVRELEGYGLPIGFSEEAVFEQYEIRLEVGDRLYVITDGIVEAFSPEEEPFGADRFMVALKETSILPLNATLPELGGRVTSWCRGRGPSDDVSIVALEYCHAEVLTGSEKDTSGDVVRGMGVETLKRS